MAEREDSGGVAERLRRGYWKRGGRVLVPFIALAALVVVTTVLFGSYGLNSAVQGVVDASIIIPGAIGLSLLYGIRKFANFAHGDLMTLGAYVAYFANAPATSGTFLFAFNGLGLNLAWGFLLAPLVLALVGIVLELTIFSKLENRSPVSPLVASIGVALVVQNVVAVLWGTSPLSYRIVLPHSWNLPGGVLLNPITGLLTIGLSTVFMVCVHALLSYTTLGKAMRATSDNAELARASGIRTRRVILWTWVVSSALAGVGGVVLGLSQHRLLTTMGFDFLLFIFASVILGGIGSAYGAMLGGLVIGMSTDMAVPFLQWMDTNWGLYHGAAYSPAVAFIIMVLVLLLRPEGILGTRRERGGAGALRWLRSFFLGRRDGAEPGAK